MASWPLACSNEVWELKDILSISTSSQNSLTLKTNKSEEAKSSEYLHKKKIPGTALLLFMVGIGNAR